MNLWGGRPDLMFLVVLIWTVVRGGSEGLLWAFIGGLLTDLLSGGPLGAMVLALLAVAVLSGQPWGQGIGSPVVRLVLTTFVAALLYHLVLLSVLAWTGFPVGWGWAIPKVALPSALFNSILAPFVRQPLKWLEQRTRPERRLPL